MKRFDSYIRKCIKNLSINYDKKEKNKWYSNIIFIDNEEDFDIKDELAEFENSVLTQEKIFVVKDIHIKVKGEKLIGALAQLSEEQRNILLLYYFEYETDLKIAQWLNSIERTIIVKELECRQKNILRPLAAKVGQRIAKHFADF